MRRDKGFEKEKELRRLYNEWTNTWRSRGEHGYYIDVPPYRVGWNKYYVLRDDIKNRKDFKRIQRALDLVNTTISCHRKDFLEKSYKTRKWVPKPHVLGHISIKKWEELPPEIQKYFEIRTVRHKYSTKTYEAYFYRWEWHFVTKIVPRMVDRRWIPDSEWESYCAEIRNKVEKNHLWPKFSRMLGGRVRHREWNNPYHQYKYGKDWNLNDFNGPELDEHDDLYNWKYDQFDYIDEWYDWKDIA